MVSPEGTVNYSHDAANRLTNVGVVTYTWDANGNLISDGVRSYTYGHANRLTPVTEGSLMTLFAYNGDGVRTCGERGRTTSKIVGGEATQYVLDLPAALPGPCISTRWTSSRSSKGEGVSSRLVVRVLARCQEPRPLP